MNIWDMYLPTTFMFELCLGHCETSGKPHKSNAR